jgi:hypothetical protein
MYPNLEQKEIDFVGSDLQDFYFLVKEFSENELKEFSESNSEGFSEVPIVLLQHAEYGLLCFLSFEDAELYRTTFAEDEPVVPMRFPQSITLISEGGPIALVTDIIDGVASFGVFEVGDLDAS